MSSPPVGLHILSELSSCEKIKYINKETLHEMITNLVNDNQLVQLGSFFYEFDGGGITAIIALAESHIAMHTWPELGYVTMEVYICNHSRDNTLAAEEMHRSLVAFLEPEKVETHRLQR